MVSSRYVLTRRSVTVEHFVIGDAHLTRNASSRVAEDLATLIDRNAGASFVFAGDLIDLAHESVHDTPLHAIHAVVDAHPRLRSAVGNHVARGGRVTILAGNHDDVLATGEGLGALFDALGLDAVDRAKIKTSPWFVRLGQRGEIHVEHGHHYDSDNAMPHPLAPPDPEWWSLGIALMHRFVAPSGAGAMVHENGAQPLHLFMRAWELYGKRAPKMISQYLLAATHQVRLSGRNYPSDRAKSLGDSVIERFAEECGLAPDVIRQIVAAGARPTMESARETFLRLYWDRALATAILATAGTSSLLGGPGKKVALGAAAVLVTSMVMGGNRYSGRVHRLMEEQGSWLAQATDAKAVVFGHIHVPTSHGVYKNTGSFGFPGQAPGRPYVRIDDATCATEHGFFPAS